MDGKGKGGGSRAGGRSPVAGPFPPREFERLVSRVCALVLRCERDGVPYRLRVGDRVFVDPTEGGRRKKALSVLARVQADGSLLPGKGKEGR